MKKDKAKPKDEAPETPAWVVSFSDMVTLLLAFFVLLQSFASERDPALFHRGQGSFRRAIAGFGIPEWLFGREDRPRYDDTKTRHPAPEDPADPARKRVLNARDEEIRRRFKQIAKSLQHQVSDVREQIVSVEATPIRFTGTDLALRPADRQFLEGFARNARQNVRADKVSIYVVGLARDFPQGRDQWLLSARRAMAVDRVLRDALKPVLSSGDWSLHSWGAGAGQPWCERLRIGTVSPRTTILIAVMALGDEHGRR